MKREDILQYLKEQGHDHVKKADDSYVRVMTSNVLFSHAQNSVDFELDYKERTDILSAMYLYFQPDFIGLQEVTDDMQKAFVERFSDVYAFVDTPTGEKLKRGEWVTYRNYTPLVYNKNLYDVVDSRFHVFHEQSCWSYHWAMYQSKTDPARRVIHMNLHYFYEVNEKQLPGIMDVHNELVHLRRHYPRIPIFVTGDYNCYYNHPNFKVMIDGLNMQTGMLLAEDIEPNGTDYWCHLIGSTELQKCGTAIDHITVTEDLVNVKVHRVLYNELLCKSSDHCSRFLDVEIKTPN